MTNYLYLIKMGIYNAIDDKKNEYFQTEIQQIEVKGKPTEKKIILEKVKEIEFEYKRKKNVFNIMQKNQFDILLNNMFIRKNRVNNKLGKTKKKNISDEKNKAIVKNIKSQYIFKKIFKKLNERKLLRIIKYNQKLKRILNIDLNDYKEYCEIEIELTPKLNKYGKFINIINK